MVSNIVPMSAFSTKRSASGSRLIGYAWPPGKPMFGLRGISFANGEWSVRHSYQGSTIWTRLDPNEREGKFVFLRPGCNPPISFEKVAGGWLGRAQLGTHPSAGKAVLLLYLSAQGKAGAGLWDLGKKTFHVLDEQSLLERPEHLYTTRTALAQRNDDLPDPFRVHGENLSYLRVLGDPLRHDWGKLSFRVVSTGDHLAWRITRRPAEGKGTLELPYAEKKKVSLASVNGEGKFFPSWSREKDRWIGIQPVPLGPESVGLVKSAGLRLALYDTGLAVLTLEEEGLSGEKTVRRIHPDWLADPREKPRVLATRKLAPSQDFGDVDFSRNVLQESFGWDPSIFRRKGNGGTLGGVSI